MNSKSKFLWLYSTVLFTAAFVLILMSAVSQNRLTKDIESYKEQLSKQKGLFQGVQKSLSTLTSENEQLQQKLEVADIKIKELQQQLEDTKEKMNQVDMQNYKFNQSIENLFQAKKYYDEKDYVESAEHLSSVYYDILTESSKTLYDSLSMVVFKEAANIHYIRGYRSYVKNELNEAVENFNSSLKYKSDAYFSDDTIYFLASSLYKLGKKNEAKELLIRLRDNYPNSTYKADTKRLLESIDNEN